MIRSVISLFSLLTCTEVTNSKICFVTLKYTNGSNITQTIFTQELKD